MTVETEQEIQDVYRAAGVAARYVSERFTSEINRLLHERQVSAVQRAINRSQAVRILEIAPGPGRVTRELCASATLICLEYNEQMIAHGRSSCNGKTCWVRGNGFMLPFAAEFDLVYSFRFVRHFHRPDRERLYAEICRVLKPGGIFLMDAVNERVSRPLRTARPQDYPINDKLYQAEELARELKDAALELIHLEPVQKCFGWQYRSQVLLGPRVAWLNRWVIRGLERLPWRDGLEWIVTCRCA